MKNTENIESISQIVAGQKLNQKDIFNKISPFFSELNKRSYIKSFIYLLVWLCSYIFLLLIGNYFNKFFLWLLLWTIMGFLFSTVFSIMHYCSHMTMFSGRLLNWLFGNIFSSLILMNFSLYKYFHQGHHKKTKQAGDTEPIGELASIGHYFLALSNWDFILGFIRLSFFSLLEYTPNFILYRKQLKKIKFDSIILFIWIILIILITIMNPIKVLYFYWIPLQVGFSINFFTSFSEHYGCKKGSDKLKNTRSVRIKFSIIKFFMLNSNYHSEHHFLPSASPWLLPLLNKVIGDFFWHTEKSYLQIHKEQIMKIISKKIESNNIPEGFYPDFNYKLKKFNHKEDL